MLSSLRTTLQIIFKILIFSLVYQIFPGIFEIYKPVVLSANSLWKDKDPYNTPRFISPGAIVKVILKNGIKAEYESEYKAQFDSDVKTVPDKKLVPEMQGYNVRNTYLRAKNGKSKTKGSIIGTMAVVVTSIDPGSGALTLEGSKIYNFGEETIALRLSGIVSPDDLDKTKTVLSDQVANLKLEYRGTLVPKELKDPNVQIKTIQNPDGTVTPRAELSQEEVQELLMKNIKRVLGESTE